MLGNSKLNSLSLINLMMLMLIIVWDYLPDDIYFQGKTELTSLQWCHIYVRASYFTCYLTFCSKIYPVSQQRKHQISTLLSFVKEMGCSLVVSLHKDPVRQIAFSCNEIFMYTYGVSQLVLKMQYFGSWACLFNAPSFCEAFTTEFSTPMKHFYIHVCIYMTLVMSLLKFYVISQVINSYVMDHVGLMCSCFP